MLKLGKNFVFTLNNYTDDEYNNLLNCDCSYIIIGKEVGAQGTPHLQGTIRFHKNQRISALKKLSERAHWENCMDLPKSIIYCKKEQNFIERGETPMQGKRTDLITVANLVKNGTSINQIANDNPDVFVKFHKGIIALKNALFKERTEPPTVIWRWGLAGTGKTRYCIEKHPSHYIKDGSMWWDGYNQEEAIIIDDFCGSWPYRDFLRLIDRYKYQGQYKGGYIHVNSPYIYITCEFPPEHFWQDNALAQVMRRISRVTEVPVTVTEVVL